MSMVLEACSVWGRVFWSDNVHTHDFIVISIGGRFIDCLLFHGIDEQICVYNLNSK